MRGSAAPSTWTRARVEAQLIAAFRMMPSCPVYGLGRQIRTASEDRTPLTEVLEWGALVAGDPEGRAHLWTWARCKATFEPFSEQINERGWRRSTAEDGRRRAADAIAAALNSGDSLFTTTRERTR